jgi:hypothetical protein
MNGLSRAQVMRFRATACKKWRNRIDKILKRGDTPYKAFMNLGSVDITLIAREVASSTVFDEANKYAHCWCGDGECIAGGRLIKSTKANKKKLWKLVREKVLSGV